MSPADAPADGLEARVWEQVTASVRAGRRYPATRDPRGLKIGPMIADTVIDHIEVFAPDGTLLYSAPLGASRGVTDGDTVIVTPPGTGT